MRVPSSASRVTPSVGGSGAGEELGAPLDATIFFAGEATESDGQNATVHDASQRAAGRERSPA